MANSINEIGLQYPQDFILESCVIVTALAKPTDFRAMVVEINYFEDIYNSSISGNLILNDSSGHLNLLGFTGNDYLVLSFGKPGLDTRKVSKVFRIYSVSNRNLVKQQNENYILNFCSEETMLSEQYKISKSYKNKKISDIVKDIMFNEMLTRKEKFDEKNIEETLGMRDIVIPNLKPFEAINWLCTQAISNSTKTEGSPYLFFENLYGYNFKSLQSLYSGSPYRTYKYEPKSTTLPDDARVQDLEAELTNVLAFENISNFNTLNSINTGGFANRLYAIDPIRQSYTVNDFDYWNYSFNNQGLNTFPTITNAKNRKGDSANSTYNSVIKTATTNTGQSTFNQYIKSKSPDIKDTNIEKRIPYRVAQLSHINTIRYKISVPGDPMLTVGKVIEFLVPELRELESGGRIWDIYYSGFFIITAVRHIISQENKFITTLEISKESLKAPYYQFDNGLPSWKEIRGR